VYNADVALHDVQTWRRHPASGRFTMPSVVGLIIKADISCVLDIHYQIYTIEIRSWNNKADAIVERMICSSVGVDVVRQNCASILTG